jgi:hypothetical protein
MPKRAHGGTQGARSLPTSRWEARPVVAWLMRFGLAAVPAVAALAVTILLHTVAPKPTDWPARIVTWGVLLGVSTITALLVERRLRRYLPLALLMRMTLVFPDAAPSRYSVARAANSPARIKELATSGNSARSVAAAQVLALVASLTKHDAYTRGHSERVRVFADLIAEQIGVSGSDRDKLAWGALLHDIGKMSVPGSLLNKPGKPTPREWEVLKGHPLAGAGSAGPLMEWLGPWAGGITEHHERFDGTGYPLAIPGQEISLSGRIVAVADSYETMTAARSYKKPMSASAARRELADCSGGHFDPLVVRAFLEISMPRLMWGVGPLAFLLHLPLMARAQNLGLQLSASTANLAAPAAAVTLGAASVVTTAAVLPTPAPPAPAVTVAATNTLHASGKVGHGAANAPADRAAERTAGGITSTAVPGRGAASTATEKGSSPGASQKAGASPSAGSSPSAGASPTAGASAGPTPSSDRSTAPAAGVTSPTPSSSTDDGVEDSGGGDGSNGTSTASPTPSSSSGSNSGSGNSGKGNSGNGNSGNGNSGNGNSGNSGKSGSSNGKKGSSSPSAAPTPKAKGDD